jgi:predicted alpha/beta superfamily hydrolase
MKTDKILLPVIICLFYTMSFPAYCQESSKKNEPRTGFREHPYTQMWRGEKNDTLFPSYSLGYEKNVTVFTPDRFGVNPDEKYPLIVTFDRNGIDLTNFIIHSVDILEMAGQIPRSVVVSIESGGESGEPGDRTKEAKWGLDGAGAHGEKYDQFVFEELIPYMIDKYKIDKNQIIIYGHSWFGYHTSMILINHIPELLGVISASPCCLSDERIADIVNAIKNCGPLDHKFFFRVASGHDIGDDLDVYYKLTGKISTLRLPDNFDYKPTWYQAAMHMEVPVLLFIQSMYEIYADWADLAFAFSDPRNSPTYDDASLYDSLQQMSDEIYGFRIPISDKHIGWRVEYYRYFKDAKVTSEGRIASWKFMISRYGEKPEWYFNIANNYQLLGQADSAKHYIRKAKGFDLSDDLKLKIKGLEESIDQK